MSGGKALVLGGGGIAGLGWLAGVLYGLLEEGVDLRDADRMIGTSAGAATAAQLRSSQSIERLYARQTETALIADETPPSMEQLARTFAAYPKLLAIADTVERMHALGALAKSAQSVAPEVRRAMIERRLADHVWPQAALTITAIDADSGEQVAFDAASGIGLVDAVGASCAVPGVWPVVAIGARSYMDGGVLSADNAHLAAGAERVLIVSPFGHSAPFAPGSRLGDQVAELERGGARVLVIELDPAARTAMGANPLDPSIRIPSAHAGRTQGMAAAGETAKFWRC